MPPPQSKLRYKARAGRGILLDGQVAANVSAGGMKDSLRGADGGEPLHPQWAEDALEKGVVPGSLGYALLERVARAGREDMGVRVELKERQAALLLPTSSIGSSVTTEMLQYHVIYPREPGTMFKPEDSERAYLGCGYEACFDQGQMHVMQAASPHFHTSRSSCTKAFSTFELSASKDIKTYIGRDEGPTLIPTYTTSQPLDRSNLLARMKSERLIEIEHALGGLPSEIARLVSNFVSTQRSHLEGPTIPATEKAHGKNLLELAGEVQYFYEEVRGMLQDVVTGTIEVDQDQSSIYEAPDEIVTKALQQIEDVICTYLYDLALQLHSSVPGPSDACLATRLIAFRILKIPLSALGVVNEANEETVTGRRGRYYEEICGEAAQHLCRLGQESTASGKLGLLRQVHQGLVTGISKSTKSRDHQISLPVAFLPIGRGNDGEALSNMDGDLHPLGDRSHVQSLPESGVAAQALEIEPVENTSSDTGPITGTSNDLLLPLLIYSIIKANPARLCSQLAFLDHLSAPLLVSGESSYCLTNMQAAVEFLMTVEAKGLALDGESLADVLEGYDHQIAQDLRRTQIDLVSDPPTSPIGRQPNPKKSKDSVNVFSNVGGAVEDGYRFLFGGLAQRKHIVAATEEGQVQRQERSSAVLIRKGSISKSKIFYSNASASKALASQSTTGNGELLKPRTTDEKLLALPTVSISKMTLSDRLAEAVRIRNKKQIKTAPSTPSPTMSSTEESNFDKIANGISSADTDRFLNCSAKELTLDQISTLLNDYRRLYYENQSLRRGSDT